MLTATPRFHHVTGIVGDAQEAVDCDVGTLGLAPVAQTDDPHLDPARVAKTVRTVDNAGAAVDERAYSDTGHEVTDDEFDAITALLEGLLSTEA